MDDLLADCARLRPEVARAEITKQGGWHADPGKVSTRSWAASLGWPPDAAPASVQRRAMSQQAHPGLD
jgi:hypothetical protein